MNNIHTDTKEVLHFAHSHEAQEFAKKNPGSVVRRSPHRDGFIVEKISLPNKLLSKSKTPRHIYEYLNKYVISQDEAKKEIASTLYYHQLKSSYSSEQKTIRSGSLMLIGPSGSGKTYLVQKGCEQIDSLFLHVDASSMVPEGIKGYRIEKIFSDLAELSGYDKHKAEHAVIFLDEIDKLFLDDGENEFGSQVSAQLLRMIEGRLISVELENEAKSLSFDTSNMLFILGGAFQNILDAKDEYEAVAGFAKKSKPKNKKIVLEDLYEYGVPKELIGRMDKIVNLKKLTQEDYYQILTSTQESPLLEFIDKVEINNNKVVVEENTLKEIANYASQNSLGARAIRQKLNQLFSEVMFESPESENKTFYL